MPVGVDPNRASIARVYDAALGGKDNYEIDRQVIEQAKKVAPEIQQMAWANRNFLIRSCRFLAQSARIEQFIDCGSGLPTAENVHQVVQRINADARVIYTDNDPVVLAHARALLAESRHVQFADVDIYKPDEVYAHPVIRKNIDFDEPVGLIHSSTIHHFPGDGYNDLMRRYIDPLPSGSFVVVSHFFDPETPELTQFGQRLEGVFANSSMGSGWFRTRDQIMSMVSGMEVIEPQPGMGHTVVPCDQWWPDGPRFEELNECQECIGGVVVRKP